MIPLAKILPLMLRPNARRTVVRPFEPGDPDAAFAVSKTELRAQRIAQRVLQMSTDDLEKERTFIARSLDDRHPDPETMLRDRFGDLKDLGIDKSRCTDIQALVIAAYFSEEYSFESAALFNPSVVRHFDQAGLAEGDTRLILSLRGIGEGHVSSLTFRTGVWKADGSIEIDTPNDRALGPRIERKELPAGELLVRLKYDCEDLSEAVIFPFMPSQGRGIEDVRLVEFTDGDGRTTYRGTYTAFDGQDVRQGLLQTSDFKSFEMRGVKGQLYQNKGMALFPRMVNGRYLMLGRQDNENIWLIESGDLFEWAGGKRILEPKYPWEYIQMGNCGSPIELDEGWLVITHGVGSVRNYCVGACLLDKDDPSKVLGRLPHPLLEPDQELRDGYVPNVVYSCGSLLRGRTLLLPYGVADNFATFATVGVDALLKAME